MIRGIWTLRLSKSLFRCSRTAAHDDSPGALKLGIDHGVSQDQIIPPLQDRVQLCYLFVYM